MSAEASGGAGQWFEASPWAGLALDGDTLRVLAANPAAARLYGRTPEQLCQMNWAELSGDAAPVWEGRAVHRREDGSAFEVEVATGAACADGRALRVVQLKPPACDMEGTLAAEVVEMLAGRQAVEPILFRIAELFDRRFPALASAALLLADGRLVHAAAPRLGVPLRHSLDGLPIEEAPGSGEPASPYWGESANTADIAADPRWSRWRALALDGGLRGCWSEPMVSGAGEILGVFSVFLARVRPLDRAERRAVRAAAHMAGLAVEHRNLTGELTYQAFHDPVTGLPNRILFEERLRQALARPGHEGRGLAILYIHLDRISVVADLLGRQVSDLLLDQAARRLEPALRGGDTLGRVREHDFAALLPGVGSPAAADASGERVRQSLAAPFAVLGHELTVTASVGAAVYPVHGTEAAALLLNAETASRAAQRTGRNRVQSFQPEMSARTRQRLLIESTLGRAAERGELNLLYQPQFDGAGGRLCGAEALLRWNHPEIGLSSPAAFIPVAEETGLIVEIGRWALVEACRQAARWAAGSERPIRVAVNVSPVQFDRDGFVESVAEALRETGLDPALLEIELTEGALAGDIDRAALTLGRLAELGAGTALDDFGTGYSSLSYLQRLPVGVIKMDRAFTQQIVSESDRPPLASGIVTLAHALGRRVVAEGIETEAQRAAVCAMGVDVLQGFLFGPPSDVGTFASRWLPETARLAGASR
ncbi:MAG: EAL domain-containing protein [Thermomicrobiales bacterium]|nr:EAL domain-containing protein [Thermomicrobiales bacterium]